MEMLKVTHNIPAAKYIYKINFLYILIEWSKSVRWTGDKLIYCDDLFA